jgi:hypothetical protein
LVGAATLTAAFVYVWSPNGGGVYWPLRLAALFPVCYVVLQGSLYWHLKLRSVSSRAALPPYFPALFRFLRASNVPAVGAPLVALAAALGLASTPDVIWSGGLIAFAVLEHVNYYAY